MPEILVVSDSPAVRHEVRSGLEGPQTTVREAARGADVRAAVNERRPDVVVLDLQIGAMGGVAACLDLRLEEGAGRMPRVSVLLLLDRRPDVFLARRSGADGWLVKPIDPLRLTRAVVALIAGGTFEDDAFQPPTVPATGIATAPVG